MTYSCSIEWIVPPVGVIRIHEGPGGKLGDPYVWSATLDRYGPLGTIKGVCSPLPKGALRAMCDEMYRNEMRHRCHERRSAFGSRWRRLVRPIRPPGAAS